MGLEKVVENKQIYEEKLESGWESGCTFVQFRKDETVGPNSFNVEN